MAEGKEKPKIRVVGGKDPDRNDQDKTTEKPDSISWTFIGICLFVGMLAFSSGWMTKTLYSDLSGQDSAHSAKFDNLEAYSAWAMARESVGEHRVVKEAERRLMRTLIEHESAYNFSDKGDSRTTGIEPVGPRIVFPDGYELLLPENLVRDLSD